MDAHDVVFYACNVIALAGWVALVGFPRSRAAAWVARTLAPSVAIAVVYAALVLVTLVAGGSGGDFFSLEGVRRLFDDRTVLTAAWIHYLAFDLAVGAWMWRRARELGVRHALLAPCLVATLWVGPVGLVLWKLVEARASAAPR